MERISIEEAREITQVAKTEYDKKVSQRMKDEILCLTNSIIYQANGENMILTIVYVSEIKMVLPLTNTA